MKKTEVWLRNSTSRNMVLVVAFLLVVNVTLAFLLIRISSSAMISLIQNRMLDMSNTAAAMLDGDVLETVTPEDQGTPGYDTIMRTLTCFQDNIELKYIYCIRDAGNKNFVFGLDPTVEDPGEFGSPIAYTDALYEASLGTAAVDTVAYEDAWGSFYSAYSPVFNSAGKVAGIVAVDFSKKWYDAQIATLISTTVITSLVSLIAGAMIVLSLTSANRKRIHTVHGQLNELADNLETLMHEIGNKAAAFHPEELKKMPSGEESIDTLGDRILYMQRELHAQIARVHEQAYVDGLTGLRNKTAYLETTKHIDMLIEQGIAVFSTAVFDMNGLKTINDKFGHEYGDVALKDAAKILASIFGEKDMFRIGGDEFIAIVKTASAEDMEFQFARLDNALVFHNKTTHSYQTPLHLSKGYSVFQPETDKGFKEVFRRADQKMYADKAAYYTKYGDRRRR